jgi:hypothetical protein
MGSHKNPLKYEAVGLANLLRGKRAVVTTRHARRRCCGASGVSAPRSFFGENNEISLRISDNSSPVEYHLMKRWKVIYLRCNSNSTGLFI